MMRSLKRGDENLNFMMIKRYFNVPRLAPTTVAIVKLYFAWKFAGGLLSTFFFSLNFLLIFTFFFRSLAINFFMVARVTFKSGGAKRGRF
jgi:hypothetical protein